MRNMLPLLLGSTALLMMMPDAASGGGGPDPAMSLIDALNSLDPDVDANWTEGGLPDVDVIERLTGNKWISRGDIEGIPITRSAAAERKAAGAVIVENPVGGAPTVIIPPDEPASSSPPPPPPPPAPDTSSSAPPPAPATPPEPTAPPPVDNDHVAAGATPFPTAQPIGRHRIVELSLSDDTPLDGDTTATGLVVKVNDDGSLNVWAFPTNGGAIQFFTGVRNTADVAAMSDGPDKNAALVCTWDWPKRT